MPTFEITGPDGRTFQVDGPEGSTHEQAIEHIKATHYGTEGETSRGKEAMPVTPEVKPEEPAVTEEPESLDPVEPEITEADRPPEGTWWEVRSHPKFWREGIEEAFGNTLELSHLNVKKSTEGLTPEEDTRRLDLEKAAFEEMMLLAFPGGSSIKQVSRKAWDTYSPQVQKWAKEMFGPQVMGERAMAMHGIKDLSAKASSKLRTEIAEHQTKVSEALEQLGHGKNPDAPFSAAEFQQALKYADDMMGLTTNASDDMYRLFYGKSLPKAEVFGTTPRMVNELLVAKETGSVMSGDAASLIGRFMGNIAEKVDQFSPALGGMLRRMEMTAKIDHLGADQKITTFFKDIYTPFSKANPRWKVNFDDALLHADKDAVTRLLGGETSDAYKLFKPILDLKDEQFKRMVQNGMLKESDYLEGHWPRIIRSLKELKQVLGKKEISEIERKITEFEDKVKRPITGQERSDIVYKALMQTEKTTSRGTTAMHERKVETIHEWMKPYYMEPEHALREYLRATNEEIAKREFFGRNARIMKESKTIDYEKSIDQLLKESGIDKDSSRFKALKSLLQSRFMHGERSPDRFFQIIRNLTHAALLGNPFSAITQLKDVSIAAARYGWYNAMHGMFKSIVRAKNREKVVDYGLHDASVEIQRLGRHWDEKIMDFALKWGQFQRTDVLGKETLLNAALRRMRQQAATDKGRDEMFSAYAKYYGRDAVNNAIRDLRSGQVSVDVKSLLWHELSEVQPISLSQMPQAYLNNPNARLMWQMKTFMLRQLNMIHKDVIKQAQAGNHRAAAKNAAKYGLYMQTMGAPVDMINDMLQGKRVTPDRIPDYFINNFLKTFGLSDYQLEIFGKGKLVQGVSGLGAPAALSLLKPVEGVMQGELGKIVQPVPVVGKAFHWWFGGGAEAYNEKLNKERR